MEKTSNVERFVPPATVGLTAEQVAIRNKQKLNNKVKKVVGKSYLAIFTGNILTLFNFIGIVIFALMLAIKSFGNVFFFVVILANTVIGIFQEIRSKRAIEKLSLVTSPTATVIRDGTRQTISTSEIVLDDVICFNAGDQISADCIVLDGEAELNESMLTGESDAVKKHKGDVLFSGSFVVSGNCVCRAEKVGTNSYVEQLSAKVKKTKAPNSEVMNSIRAIIRVIGIVIFPMGLATFLTSGYRDDVILAIKQASGSVIGMIPCGMVLLLAVSFAVSALKLAYKKVLVRELPCIEMLARVDTLCLDKTGTITDGTMTVEKVVPLVKNYNLKQLLASIVNATGDSNVTAKAIANFGSGEKLLSATAKLPFSSARKFSAATFDGVGTVAFGAPEFMFKHVDGEFTRQCSAFLSLGLRVMAVGVSKSAITGDKVDDLQPIGIVVLSDTIRSDAREIIQWFKDNDVQVKIISGDNPLSVSVIAQKVGVENAEKFISLEGMTDDEVAKSACVYTVFGRVTPEQKAVLVKAMKQNGRTVAMTGDGVNDILAMRESDCAVTVGSGTDAAKTAAHIVLSDDKFSSMPSVVAEGRQVVNNVQNSSTLFLMKTTMTVLVTLVLLFLPYRYPFQPMHLYGIEFGITGICTFMLTFKPNHSLIKGHFIPNVLKRMLPSGLALALSVILVYCFKSVLNLSDDQITTVAMLSATFTGLVALIVLLVPFDKFNVAVAVVCVAFICGVIFGYNALFNGSLANVLNPDGTSVFMADVTKQQIVFVVCNVLAQAGIIVGGKYVIKSIEKSKEKN